MAPTTKPQSKSPSSNIKPPITTKPSTATKPTKPHTTSNPPQPHPKLPRLPSTHTLQKRPLLRPTLSSPYTSASSQKIIYISSRTPFMSAIKRIQKLLALSSARSAQSATASVRASKKRKRGMSTGEEDEIVAVAEMMAQRQEEQRRGEGGEREEVVVKGTGKAVQKALSVGGWFLQREGYEVRVRTGSVRAVDDVVLKEEVEGIEEDGDDKHGDEEMGDDGQEEKKEEEAEEVEVPETRVRWASTVEVAVFLT